MNLQGILDAGRPPWSIRQRLTFLVLAIAVPMNFLIVITIIQLGSASRQAQYTNHQFTARAIVSALEG